MLALNALDAVSRRGELLFESLTADLSLARGHVIASQLDEERLQRLLRLQDTVGRPQLEGAHREPFVPLDDHDDRHVRPGRCFLEHGEGVDAGVFVLDDERVEGGKRAILRRLPADQPGDAAPGGRVHDFNRGADPLEALPRQDSVPDIQHPQRSIRGLGRLGLSQCACQRILQVDEKGLGPRDVVVGSGHEGRDRRCLFRRNDDRRGDAQAADAAHEGRTALVPYTRFDHQGGQVAVALDPVDPLGKLASPLDRDVPAVVAKHGGRELGGLAIVRYIENLHDARRAGDR
jgi:hypothetical protein